MERQKNQILIDAIEIMGEVESGAHKEMAFFFVKVYKMLFTCWMNVQKVANRLLIQQL